MSRSEERKKRRSFILRSGFFFHYFCLESAVFLKARSKKTAMKALIDRGYFDNFNNQVNNKKVRNFFMCKYCLFLF